MRSLHDTSTCDQQWELTLEFLVHPIVNFAMFFFFFFWGGGGGGVVLKNIKYGQHNSFTLWQRQATGYI